MKTGEGITWARPMSRGAQPQMTLSAIGVCAQKAHLSVLTPWTMVTFVLDTGGPSMAEMTATLPAAPKAGHAGTVAGPTAGLPLTAKFVQ